VVLALSICSRESLHGTGVLHVAVSRRSPQASKLLGLEAFTGSSVIAPSTWSMLPCRSRSTTWRFRL
jgi:hypothetical protein